MNESTPKKSIPAGIVAIILWFLSFGLGLEDIYAVKELISLWFLHQSKSLAVATNAGLSSVYILGLLFLIFIIIATEFHAKHYGTPRSWRLFAWTFAVEILIYILYIIF
ncbi:MAG: hypothetical protein QM730_07780 [Anaerolineales bacterium]